MVKSQSAKNDSIDVCPLIDNSNSSSSDPHPQVKKN